MSFSSLFDSILLYVLKVPLWHWAVMIVISISVFLLLHKKHTSYGALVLGMTVFTALILLDLAIGIRLGGFHYPYPGIDIGAELNSLIQGNQGLRVVMVFNIVVFIPFGFFLSEFFINTRHLSTKHQLGIVALYGFGLSLCIECFQLFLRVGFFEFTDIVLNTLGAVAGTALSILFHLHARIVRHNNK